jgi:putative transposase
LAEHHQGKMMTVVRRNKRAKPDQELLKLADSLMANYKKPEGLIRENGLLKQLTKMLICRASGISNVDHLPSSLWSKIGNVVPNGALNY